MHLVFMYVIEVKRFIAFNNWFFNVFIISKKLTLKCRIKVIQNWKLILLFVRFTIYTLYK